MILETNRRFGLIFRDHEFKLPLDARRPDGETISVFAREVVDQEKDASSLPWLVYFQGGPGYASPRLSGNSGWTKKALEKYRLLLLDQRGTGRSSPLTHQTLAHLASPQEQADFLAYFRADHIVADAEAIRKELAGPDTQWSVLGQSFGGFCILHYLSAAPHGLKEAFITGGVPSLTRSAEDVYRATYRTCLTKNDFYYACYPGDREKIKEIADWLRDHDVRLPCGDHLSVRRFQLLGLNLGFARGPEAIHHTIEGAFIDGPHGRELTYGFLRAVENALAFDTNPLYALLHETIYAQQSATRWAAERVRAEFPQFDSWDDQFRFVGEMVGPWIFEEYGVLQPLKEAAHLLAEKDDWPMLYDLETLKRNTVPTACAVYANDLFVHREFSLETVEAIPNMQAWVTSEYEHGGIGIDGERVFTRLSDLVSGRIDR